AGGQYAGVQPCDGLWDGRDFREITLRQANELEGGPSVGHLHRMALKASTANFSGDGGTDNFQEAQSGDDCSTLGLHFRLAGCSGCDLQVGRSNPQFKSFRFQEKMRKYGNRASFLHRVANEI